MKTGQKIAELRQTAGLTQQGLADMLFVSQQLVSCWEKGSRRPDNSTLEKLADIFGVPSGEIFSPDEILMDELSLCIPENLSLSQKEAVRHINVFLSLLSDKERYIFIRRYYHCDEITEIAEKIGLKENHVRTVLSRVRKKLKKYFTEVKS